MLHLPTTLTGALLSALYVFGGYALYRLSIFLNASGLAKKIANAENWLVKKLTPYVGQKTIAEVEQLVETEIAAEVGKIAHLPTAQIITIADAVIHMLFGKAEPAPTPAPDPTPAK